MAIYGIGGKPGSGKTFWVVTHLLKKYFQYDKVLDEYFPRIPIAIISNVEELKLDHYLLQEMIEKAGGVSKFFTVDYQKELLKRFPRIVYVIDEAGSPDYFPVKLKDEKMIFFFQYHRHLGIDIYLIAPGVSNICGAIVRLMEYRVQANARSKRLLREFRYDKIVEGDKAGKQVLMWDRRVFALYKSMSQSEGETVGSLSRKYIYITVFFIIGAIVAFGYFINMMMKGSRGNAQAKEVVGSKIQKKENKGTEFKEITKEEIKKVVAEKKVTFDDLENEYERVRILKSVDGKMILYRESGEIIDLALQSVLIRDCVDVDGAVYVKKLKNRRGESGAIPRTPYQALTPPAPTQQKPQYPVTPLRK